MKFSNLKPYRKIVKRLRKIIHKFVILSIILPVDDIKLPFSTRALLSTLLDFIFACQPLNYRSLSLRVTYGKKNFQNNLILTIDSC